MTSAWNDSDENKSKAFNQTGKKLKWSKPNFKAFKTWRQFDISETTASAKLKIKCSLEIPKLDKCLSYGI